MTNASFPTLASSDGEEMSLFAKFSHFNADIEKATG